MKKTILCALMFTWLTSSAGLLMPAKLPATGVNLVEALAKDNDFIKMNALSFNLIQTIEQGKSLDLIKKYHKKTITPEEKARLLSSLKFSDEAQLTAIYKSIFECRNNLLVKFPELKQKSQEELVKIISAATKSKMYSNTDNLRDVSRVQASCWELWRTATFKCFIDNFNNAEAYDNCMSDAWDLYHWCLLAEPWFD